MVGQAVRLGFAVGTGEPVELPLRHVCVTGMTQEAGKTTALEGLIHRAGVKAVAFVTKRGEGSFLTARRIPPYFCEQADWRFVSSILEASRGERLKFERAWIIRASRGATTLAQVQENVRSAMLTAKGLSADVYLTLDAYLDVVVPTIAEVEWAPTVQMQPGINVMDLTDIPEQMQHLVIKSTVDWVLHRETDTVVVVPEAWKFLPQGRGTPVKLAAEAYIRQGAASRNYLWLDSQDLGGIEKTILRSVPVWLIGVQREANELKRTLANIPSGTATPTPGDIARLGVGEFYACWREHVVKTYAQPVWLGTESARAVACGEAAMVSGCVVTDGGPSSPLAVDDVVGGDARQASMVFEPDDDVEAFIDAARDAEDVMTDKLILEKLDKLADAVTRLALLTQPPAQVSQAVPAPSEPVMIPSFPVPSEIALTVDEIYPEVKRRLLAEAPALLKVLTMHPSLVVEVSRKTLTVDGDTPRGRVAQLLAEGYFAEPKASSVVGEKLSTRGRRLSNIELGNALKDLVELGFLSRTSQGFLAVPDMAVQVTEAVG